MIQRPMAETALALPDVIAEAWGAVVRHARPLAPLAIADAVVAGALQAGLLQILPEENGEVAFRAEDVAAPWLIVLLLAPLLQLWIQFGMTRMALWLFRGEPAAPRPALRSALGALPAGVVATLITAVVAVVLAVTILLIPLALYFFVSWLFAIHLIFDEGLPVFGALGRSHRLVRGEWWRTCRVGLAVLVLALLPGIVFAQVGTSAGSDGAAIAASALASLIGAPFLAFGHARLYLDIRTRKREPLRPARPPEGTP